MAWIGPSFCLMVLLAIPASAKALRCYSSTLSPRFGSWYMSNYVCPPGYGACGIYKRPCNNVTHAGCSLDETLQQTTKTEYACFWSLDTCRAVAQLEGYTVLNCCDERNCNDPGSAGSLARAQPWLVLLLPLFITAILLYGAWWR